MFYTHTHTHTRARMHTHTHTHIHTHSRVHVCKHVRNVCKRGSEIWLQITNAYGHYMIKNQG